MDSAPSTNVISQPGRRLSALFRDSDADISFVSSDDILFKIHSVHLRSGSAGLSVPRNTVIESEEIPLPERSEVLEILFQFTEPPPESRNFRQPSMLDVETALFFEVAEAAEKYVVYAAMNVCFVRMKRQMVSKNSLEVLNHCFKHGYPELANQAAKISLSQSLNMAAMKITAPGALRQWLIYKSKWVEAAHGASTAFNKKVASDCHAWTFLYTIYLRQLGTDPSTFRTVPRRPDHMDSFECSRWPCTCKIIYEADIFPWDNELVALANGIPSFSSI